MSVPRQDFEMLAGDALPIRIAVSDVDLTNATGLRWAIRKVVNGQDLVIKTKSSGVMGSAGLMAVQLETRDTFSILGDNTLPAPQKFLHEAVVDMGYGEVSVCWGIVSVRPTIAKTGVATALSFTYYVDPTYGSDYNDGLTSSTPWQTNHDSIVLADGESIGFLFNGGWALMRKNNMRQSDFVLPSNVYTGSSDQY